MLGELQALFMTVYDLLLSMFREVEGRHILDLQRDIQKNGVGK